MKHDDYTRSFSPACYLAVNWTDSFALSAQDQNKIYLPSWWQDEEFVTYQSSRSGLTCGVDYTTICLTGVSWKLCAVSSLTQNLSRLRWTISTFNWTWTDANKKHFSFSSKPNRSHQTISNTEYTVILTGK